MGLSIIIPSILIFCFVGSQAYIYFSSGSTQAQKYKVLRKGTGYEIRFYPAVAIARINSSAKSYKQLGSSGFGKLAGYIFGGNESGQKIAMTAPVHMEITRDSSSMSFVMPDSFNTKNLPKPKDSNVIIEETGDEYVAAIQFCGFASDGDIEAYSKKLEDALKTDSISFYGHFRFLGYNPPFQLFGRKNEIIVNVLWSNPK